MLLSHFFHSPQVYGIAGNEILKKRLHDCPLARKTLWWEPWALCLFDTLGMLTTNVKRTLLQLHLLVVAEPIFFSLGKCRAMRENIREKEILGLLSIVMN